MSGKVLEAHEISVFGADCFTVNQNVLLFMHKLLESLFCDRAGVVKAHEQLRVLHV